MISEQTVKRAVISVQSIIYIFCDTNAGMEFGALCETATSVPFMPQFGTEYEGSSCTKQTWMGNYQWLSIQVSPKPKDYPRAILSFIHYFLKRN